MVVVGGFAGHSASDTMIAGSGFLAASPSLAFGRLANNHANITASFHPYRRWYHSAPVSTADVIIVTSLNLTRLERPVLRRGRYFCYGAVFFTYLLVLFVWTVDGVIFQRSFVDIFHDVVSHSRRSHVICAINCQYLYDLCSCRWGLRKPDVIDNSFTSQLC